MSVSVVLGNAPAYAGGASFALFLVLLTWASAIDLRERRIPNKLVIAMAALWLAVRVLLAVMVAACSAGAFGVDAQMGNAASAASVAAMRVSPFGLTLGDGLWGRLCSEAARLRLRSRSSISLSVPPWEAATSSCSRRSACSSDGNGGCGVCSRRVSPFLRCRWCRAFAKAGKGPGPVRFRLPRRFSWAS